MIFVSFWVSARSRRDFLHLTKIAEILPWCLWVNLKSCQVRSEIFYISLRLARSRQDCWDLAVGFDYFWISVRPPRDFKRHRLLTKIAKISQRSRQDLERKRERISSRSRLSQMEWIIFRVEFNCFVVDHICKLVQILMNPWKECKLVRL